MASVNFKNIDGVEKLVVDSFTQLKNERSTLIEVATFARKRIQQQTRLGNSMPNKAKLKPLSAGYREARANKKGGTDPQFFSPSKSNLTLSGQMLASLKERIVQTPGSVNEPSVVEVSPTGQRNDGLANSQVAEFVREGGRPFLGLDEKATNQIKNIVLKNLRRVLRKTF